MYLFSQRVFIIKWKLFFLFRYYLLPFFFFEKFCYNFKFYEFTVIREVGRPVTKYERRHNIIIIKRHADDSPLIFFSKTLLTKIRYFQRPYHTVFKWFRIRTNVFSRGLQANETTPETKRVAVMKRKPRKYGKRIKMYATNRTHNGTYKIFSIIIE